MTQSFQQLLVTNYGLLPSGYTGSQGIQGVPGTSDSTPKITAIAVTDSSYTVLDDTAVDVAGGYVQITGTGFASGCVVMINNAPATSTTFVGSTQVQAQLPATAAGTYVVYLVNADGGVAIRINGITFSATPAWTTASALPGTADGTAISIQLAAEGADTYALAAGSSLPGTITLTSGGLLSGVVSGLENETTYSFTVVATDAELQDSPRTFSITITAGDLLFAATTLLLSGSVDTFVRDASTNNFAVSVAGDTRPNTFNPYLTGWSNYFDGTGDYLTAPCPSMSGTWTIELWWYPTVGTSQQTFVSFNSGGSGGINIWMNGSNQQLVVDNGIVESGLFGGGTFTINAWNHVAIVRDGTTTRAYINGASVGSNTFIPADVNTISIGRYNGGSLYYVNGYISNLRVVIGTEVYTTAFTPPTQPLEAIAGTSLLTCQSNRFIDNSTNNFAVTRSGDVAVRSFSPFLEPATANGSGYFDGTGDYLTATAGNLGSGDFTVEYWVYYTSFYNYISNLSTTRGSTGWSCGSQAAGQIVWYSSVAEKVRGTTTMVPNTWNHVAFVRSGGTLKGYLNGVQDGTSSTETTNFTNTSFAVGRLQDATPGEYFTGYMSDVRIVTDTAVYTANFTPPTEPLTAIANTSLLTLQNNQPVNNSQFLDSSSSNFPITRAGNATQGTFSPYSPAGWSNYFDGTGDYLSLPTSAAILGSGNFTIELWVYPQLLANLAIIDTRGASTSTNGWLIHYRSDGFFTFLNDGNSVILTTSTAPLNEWTHIAVCRVGSTVTFYVNGVASGTATNSSAFDPSSLFYIGIKSLSNSSNVPFLGYMSNIRLVSGTAVYTTNFTPPTQPLTAIAGTSLLTCQSPQFADLSPNRSAITRAGDTRVTNFAPFRAVTQTPVTYSNYFSSTDSSSFTNTNNQITFGTGDFTIEFWVNYNTPASTNTFNVALRNYNTDPFTTDYFYLGKHPSATVPGAMSFWVGNYAGSLMLSDTSLPAAGWNHFAIVRNGNTWTMYRNGTGVHSVTSSVSMGTRNNNLCQFGVDMAGYLSNLRVVKGTAVYTSDFTPSTVPLTAIAGTSLLTCQNSTFADNSLNRFVVTTAGTSQPSLTNPFGFTFTNTNGYSAAEHGGSMFFDGDGDTVTSTTASIINFGTGSFTVEAWVYMTSIPATSFQVILTTNPQSNNGFQIYRNPSVGIVYGGISASENVIIPNASFTTGQWYHISVSRTTTGTNGTSVYVNGTRTYQYTDAVNYSISGFSVGGYNASIYWPGYITGVRVIKGQALYTSSFVPPAAPVTPIPNTVLLLNGTGAAITDATTRNVLETVGDARISTAVAKFGSSSISFDGVSDGLTIPSSKLLDFEGDFTIEVWVYFNQLVDAKRIFNRGLFNSSPNIEVTTGASGAVALRLNQTATTLPTESVSSVGVLTTGAWIHLAVVRNGSATNNVKLYVNGVAQITTTNTASINPSADFLIGSYTGLDRTPNCYMQDFRVTRGHARYTANFTPPVTAFQTR